MLQRTAATAVLIPSILLALATPALATEPVPLTPSSSCPGIRLQALESYYADGPSVLIRRDQQPDLLLGQGLAQFSPNCARFWRLSNGMLSIFDVKDLASTNGIPANSALWLQDSETIVFSRDHRFELFALAVASLKVTQLFKPEDSTPCRSFGDGPDWRPPVMSAPNIIEWTYAVRTARADDNADQGGKPAKTVHIDARTGKVLKTAGARMGCDYYDPAPPARAKKVK